MGRNLPNTGSMAAHIIFQVRMVHCLQLSSVLELRPPTALSESTSSQSLQRKLMSRTQVCQVPFGQLPSLIFFFNLKFLLFNIPTPPHHHLSSYLYLLVSGIYSQTVGQLLDCSFHFSLLHLMISNIHCADCNIHIVTYLPPPMSFLISVV